LSKTSWQTGCFENRSSPKTVTPGLLYLSPFPLIHRFAGARGITLLLPGATITGCLFQDAYQEIAILLNREI